MKNKELFKEKIKLVFQLIASVIITYLIAMLFYLIVLDEIAGNFLGNCLYRINYGLYYWCVRNKSTIFITYLVVILIINLYLFFSKKVDNIAKIYNLLDKILDENNDNIELPSEMSRFSEKLTKINYEYVLSKKNAKEAEQKKNDLIMYMAHDLKTPLTSVIGYLTLLNEEKNVSKNLQEKYIKIALDKSLRLEELTNQFFEITRYNLQEIPITKNKIDLSFLIEQLIDEFYPMLQERGLKYNIKKPEHIYFLGDGDKLARAFGNLIKNAIHYSYENTVIEIELLQYENKIKIIFKNKGDKIPEYKLDKIFDKFYRVDESRTSSTGGTGLGLAITKEIIELHNGSISVKNDNEYIEFDIELENELFKR